MRDVRQGYHGVQMKLDECSATASCMTPAIDATQSHAPMAAALCATTGAGAGTPPHLQELQRAGGDMRGRKWAAHRLEVRLRDRVRVHSQVYD